MELSSSDLGCVSLSDETQINDPCPESASAENCDSSSSVVRTKSKSPKGSPPNALNRLTSQIKKPPHRKTSPIHWLPRKKGDTYLSRKIKLIQEAGGMNDSLGETLGHSNPHYCRVEREKMAAKEAAREVMNARKAAMVEASWCRILQAARIPTKEAEALVLKAEKEVREALETATSKGVIMYDTPDRTFKHLEIQTSGKGFSSTHTVKAAFETAFEVDKQVAAAVKTAFTRLAHCSSINRDEFKELLRRISENPDDNQELSEFDSGENPDDHHEDEEEDDDDKKLSSQKFSGTILVDMMLERLKCLKEDELDSLATIVATCGLNAALDNSGNHNKGVKFRQVQPDLPSLDKFLVKKMTRLEREIQEARRARKAESSSKNSEELDDKSVSSVDVKHTSKLEEEVEQEDAKVPSLDKFLVKHVSRLEREVMEAKNRRRDEQTEKENVDYSNGNHQDGNVVVSSRLDDVKKKDAKPQLDTNVGGLDQILVKHKSRLEREKTTCTNDDWKPDGVTSSVSRRQAKEKEMLETWGGISLGAIRPQISRLERDKVAWRKAEEEERRTIILQEH